MSCRTRLLCVYIFCLIFTPACINAQTKSTEAIENAEAEAARASKGELKNEIQIWGGYGFNSRTPIGQGVDGSRMGVVAIRYSHRWNMNRIFALKYIFDVIPLHVLSFEQQRHIPLGGGVFRTENFRSKAYGFGVSPFGGVQLNLLPKKKYQPFFGLNTGILYFNKRVPNELGDRFNFLAELSAGVDIKLGRKRNMTIAYKLYHVSNFYRGNINPGFNTNMIVVGYSLKKW